MNDNRMNKELTREDGVEGMPCPGCRRPPMSLLWHWITDKRGCPELFRLFIELRVQERWHDVVHNDETQSRQTSEIRMDQDN